jgi:tetratricopeptide (TPR) repeat protein
MADRASQPERYQDYDARRQQFMTHLQNGCVRDALALALPDVARSTPGVLLQIDALRLNGIALVLDERPQEAAFVFQQALGVATQEHPYESLNIMLLDSDAWRRAGHGAGAEAAWLDAVRGMAALATAPIPIRDPLLWERAAYLRPVNCPWPAEVAQRVTDANVLVGLPSDSPTIQLAAYSPASSTSEAPIWAAIGHSRLLRDEPQAALVALKRAESMAASPLVSGRLRLLEAKSLMRLGQTSATATLLIGLASSQEITVSHPALAMLGSLKLQQGSVPQGLNLLRRAVEQDASATWPERADAEADLGLAYLVAGDEAAGLRWLHAAQQEFEASGQAEALTQSLENEADYLESVQKYDLAKAARQRLHGY